MSPVYVALDLETTGLNPSRDAIIEVGAVKFDDRRELGTFRSLVNPGRPIPLQVTQLTGITDRDIITAPPFSALREKLSRFVAKSILVGHNIGFDLAFLRQVNCLAHNASIDTFELASILMPHESRYSLGKLIDSLGISFVNRHRALDDARASMHLFRALQEHAAGLPLNTLQTINQAARSSRWSLRNVFREAERCQARGGEGNTVGAQLRAKGLIGETPLFSNLPPKEPLIPVDQRVVLDVEQLAGMLHEGGGLAKSFPDFEYRPQQVEMLRAVSQAFNQSQHLIVEAGTGTGKSIAYLLPSMYWAVQNGERVVISTNTINLQDQLYGKDIPDLGTLLPFEVRATVLKGRSNYLCMRRLEILQTQKNLSEDELRIVSKVWVWLPNTVTGDRAELFMPNRDEWQVWSRISSDAATCAADRCPYRRGGTCFFYRAHRSAENAHIVIVNHALLLSDVATENRVLPAHNYLIVDEAHHLEDATTHQLGYVVTQQDVKALIAQDGRRRGSLGNFFGDVLAHCQGRIPDEVMRDLEGSVDLLRKNNARVMRGLRNLFDDLTVFIAEQGGNRGQYDYRVRLTQALRFQPEWEQVEVAWDGLAEELQTVMTELDRVIDVLQDVEGLKVPGYEDVLQEGIGLSRQLHSTYEQMEAVLTRSRTGEIAWVQARAKTDDISLCAVPLRVGHLVEQHLLWPKEAAIFTSATLRTNGDFSFIKERLGARDAEERAVGSPFDYESQVLLYLPTDIPEPNQPYHQKMINQSLLELAHATRGRMLVLFTSYSQLRAVNKAISRPLADRGVTVYAQGQGASRSQLLENFRTTPQAVLLGTRSFWEGVDVPGEALSCLVVARLPFAVPSDPVFAARSAEMDDPFYQYMVPDAILRFRQGFGRLIRTRNDRGVVVILDRRLQTKKYGDMFLNSLPPCTTIRGPISDLLVQAAAWIDQGPAGIREKTETYSVRDGDDIDDGELEYVSFDEI
jgi:DNA polymerase-3 subunit epsilon/ATP-dependent DNA helicase DinG